MNLKLTLYPASPMTCRTIGTFPLWMLIVFCLSFLPHAIQAGNIFRVSPNGTGDGSSWSNTTTLRNALDLAQEGDEIWVQGFREAETHDKDKHYCVPADMPDGFVVREGIKLYGGFAGTENSIDERAFTEKVFCFTYRTILTGDIKDDDVINPLTLIFPSNATRTDNATHVLVVHSGTGSTATTVNGFTIADGQADGDGEKGGGILVTGSGGNYNIEKCYFINNYATTGGAVYVEPDAGSSTSSVSLCRVFNNAAGTRSSSNNDGGGLCIAGYGHVDNCVITNNENGGVLLASKAYVINATIARNTSGGIDLMTENIGNNIQVYNTVVWRNTTLYATFQPGMSHCGFPQAPQPADSNGNIYVSTSNNEQTEYAPRFAYPSSKTGYDIESTSSYGSYQIWDWSFPYNSVLTDNGTNNNITILQSRQDITGSPRTRNGRIDIGAYEYQTPSLDRIRYVKPGGTGRGTSWDDAMGDPQSAIDDLANTSDGHGEVWVAGGVYEPQTQIVAGRSETVYFLMRDGIDMYGGFAGTEASKKERKLKDGGMPWDFEHETILQGNHYNGMCTWNATSNCWEPTSNSRHIVWLAPQNSQTEFNQNTVLNGFTIRGGYADGDGDITYQPGRGAGVYMASNSTLSNCIIKENRANNEGGAVYCSTGTVEACLIYNNSSIQSDGGGIYLENSGLIRRCAVINNSAHNGGGVYMNYANSADNHPEYLILTSSVISNNHSTENAAVFCNKGGIVLQSTICNNYTPRATDAAVTDASQTGGLYANEYTLVVNSILWNNMNNNTRIPMYAASPTASKVQFINTAISDVGNAIWNNVLQDNIYEISSHNTIEDEDLIAPYFLPAGATMTSDDALYENIGIRSDWKDIDYYWIPQLGSPLRGLGQTLGLFPSAVSVTPEVDIAGKTFNMRPGVGAARIDAQPIVPATPDARTLRIYVNDVNTPPDHDGSSWALAYRSLNEALAYFGSLSAEATTGKKLEIYMQEHTSFYPRYYFTNDDPRTATVNVPRTQSGQPIYIKGGFSSTGGENRTYDPLTYRTIIDGNPDGKTLDGGLYHCITVDENAEAVLEGFHVINGYSAESAQLNYGAGMRVIKGAKVTLRDCIFENNSAVTGTAVDAREASLTMENCVINNNTCYNLEGSQVSARELTLNHVTFVHNNGGTYTVSDGGTGDVKNTFAAGNTTGNTHDIAVTHENFANPTNSPGATLGFATYLGGYSNFRPLTSSKEMADHIINHGTATDLKEDIAKKERNLGGIPDLGAYEAILPQSGRVYYVRTAADGGNDNNDGLSWQHPFATIRKAVNTALQGAVINNEHPQVWVAAGTYSQNPTGSSYNCFDIEDGVNVYGAFPKTGTPGMDERHPLVSQHVYNNTPEYQASDYETILQPGTSSGNRRVLGQIDDYNPYKTTSEASTAEKWNAKTFTYPTEWNGFTLRNGYLDSNGISFLTNGKRNGGAGAAIFKQVTLTNCIVYNNENTSTNTGKELRGGAVYCDFGTLVNCYVIGNRFGGSGQYTAYGGGVYMRDGLAYNCVIYQNTTTAQYGDGAGIFLDGSNIFFNNTIANNTANINYRGNGGICTWNNGSTVLTIYNCISVDNVGHVSVSGNKDIASNGGQCKCYHSIFNSTGIYSNMSFENCEAISNTANLFEDKTAAQPNYRIKSGATSALNKGDNTPTINNKKYNLFNYTDMDYNARIQDCTIDIGAFERDNSDMIDAQKNDAEKAYIYYVTNAGEGTADASSPENAACEMKLQQVLTAAGKKAAEVTNGYRVIVRIAGYDRDENIYHANTLETADNPMSYTYAIPYGITVEGGWNDHYNDEYGKAVTSFTERDIPRFCTTLTPVATVGGQEVNGFHAISFGKKPADWKNPDAVTLVDGLFLTGGSATSISSLNNPNTRGGAAIVPAWGHVSRCIISGNEANMGGGLYLLPGALVSGCLISNNNADEGAGIYAGVTDDIHGNGATADADTRSHIFTSTIVRNRANDSGGGISTENGASLGQDLTVWGNKAPSDKNMSGTFDITFEDNLTAGMLEKTTGEILTAFYPYNDCFVETFEMPTSMDNNTAMTSDESVYFTGNYMPKIFSPLIKAGMKTIYYQYLVDTYALPETDIYGMSYIQEDIDKIDVGCFAVEGGVMTVEGDIITRLFVSRTKRFDFTDENILKYKGQSFLTPLTELDEALEYIKKVRTEEKHKDTKFEIFITGGTYKPSYRRTDAQTTTINQRQNSFVVPAGVSIFGGFSGDELYSFDITSLTDEQGHTYTLTPKSEGDIPSILSQRASSDFNGNGISEPWELADQTILSGEINMSATEHCVYHVVYTDDSRGGHILLDGLTITKGETVSELDPNAYNELGRGGGIYSNYVDYTLNRCRLLDNRAMRGNAIYARHANITVNGSFFANNSSVDNIPAEMAANVAGGAIYLSGDGTAAKLRAFNSLWTNNETAGSGGIFAATDQDTYRPYMLLVNNTVARNKANAYSVTDVPTGDIINTLFWGNEQTQEDTPAVSAGLNITYSACEYPLTDNDDANHNIRLNTINMEVDGPRFRSPSDESGAAGNASTNQWNPAAISVLADAGNGELAKGLTAISESTGAYKDHMTTYLPDYLEQYMGTLTDNDGNAIEYKRFAGPKNEYGEDDVKPIDIGLYEYQYKLTFPEMDAVYIATYESGNADGSSWSNASSDLRGAIVALAHPTGNSSTHTTKHKHIYVKKGDYDYAISQLFAGGVAFNLQMGDSEFGDSLTIQGSYNNQGVQDFSNPSIITCNPVNAEKTRKLMQINANGKHVTIEGFEFHNPNGYAMEAGAGEGGSVTLKNVYYRNNKEDAITLQEHAGDMLIVNAQMTDGQAAGLDCEGQMLAGGKVTVVNTTFAHNRTDLTGTPEVYNSVAWRNTLQNLTGTAENHNANIPWDIENTDIENGPNFKDPENADIMKRDYSLRPSVRLLNQGSNDLYMEKAGVAETEKDGERDLGNNKRFIGTSIDVGAFEYSSPLQPIIYVKSGLAGGTQDGTSWANATGDLQGAANLAGLYKYNYGNDGYVFVHSNVTGTSLEMTIPGSRIYGNMNDETPLLGNEDLHTPEDVQSVTQDLLNRRDGMMESTTHSSLDNVSIHAANVVDGFEVTGKATLSDGGMLSTSILQATAETTVNENGILYNSFVDGGVNGRGGEIVNVTATGHIDTGQAKTAANLRNDTETVNDYITTDVWKYQLNEKSEDIDAGNLTDISAYTAYAGHSRDLAGNPRTLNNRPDNGCFETWNIPAGQAWQTADADKHYPVNGSVVYLHEGADLVLGQSAAFRPGYLLLRKDASLYGNGSTVQVPYVGVEKEISEGWNMTALPYALTRDGIAMPDYNAENRLVLTPLAASDSTETYDGQARAASLNQYYADNSPFWKAATAFGNGQGFALKTGQTGIYRFTGGRESTTTFVYEEQGEDKTVTLTQYDLKNVSSDGKPNFTYKENMGWNLFGIPYLVSRYDLGETDIPHVVYQWNDGTYSTVQTWEGGESATGHRNASVGEGMFTQTAVIGTAENLHFPRPVYREEAGLAAMGKYHLFLTSETGEDRFIFGTTDREGAGEEYAAGSDGLKLMALRKTAPQVYATGSTGTRFSLMNEVDETAAVQIGVKTVAGEYTFSLGETADLDMQEEVWLTDRKTGSRVNLRQTDYRFTTTEAEDAHDRFTLAFSRMAGDRATVNVYTRGLTLYVEGVPEGKTINVYDTGGQLIRSARSDGNTFSCSLTRGVYIVNTSASATRKVLVQ